MAIQQSLEQVRIPKLRRAADGSATFKLSVRVLGASVPGLEAPGLTLRQRPFLEALLNGTKKETEFADFDTSLNSVKAGAGAHECPWRFSDTLTFATRLQDVMGPGLKLNLRAKKELSMGFLQLELQAGEIGEGAVDLRQRALPACVQEKRGDNGHLQGWSSPMVLVPLSHVRGGICGGQNRLGEAVAHVALAFTVDTDPEEILSVVNAGPHRVLSLERTLEEAGRKIEAAEREFEKHVATTRQSLGNARRKIEEHGNRTLQKMGETERRLDQQLMRMEQRIAASVEQIINPLDSEAALARAEARSSSTPRVNCALSDPDFDPEGWVCKFGPNGQAYWHHQALGPAPWETAPEGSSQARRPAGATNGGARGPRGAPERPGASFPKSLLPEPKAAMRRASNALQASVSWLVPEGMGGSAANTPPPARGRPAGMATPDEAPEGWVCHHGADGRTFWHNTALGPPPWESAPTCRSDREGVSA